MPKCMDCVNRKRKKRCRAILDHFKERECEDFVPDLKKISNRNEERYKRELAKIGQK